MSVCTYVCMYVCVYIRTYVCTYVCLYVCMYVRTYVYPFPTIGLDLHEDVSQAKFSEENQISTEL